MTSIDFNNLYFDRIRGYFTELRVDSRWILRNQQNKKPCGSLRIVSHPDLPPGHLRAIFTYVTEIRKKGKNEILQTIEDYQMNETELEVYSIDDEIKTNIQEYNAQYKELEELFNVNIFE